MADAPGSFGSYLDKNILKQIEVRQDIQGRIRTNEEYAKSFETTYHNAPWVCLRSNVDAPSVGVFNPKSPSPTTNVASICYILCGGTLTYDGMDGGKPKLKFDGQLKEPKLNGRGIPGYVSDSSMGYRPKPGITKMTVKTKDTFGCIMEATVDFMVYSVDDLELIDQIYFKPGMSALLEWGHTSYVDNNGKTQYMTGSDLFSFPDWLGNCSFTDLETKLQNHRLELQEDGKTPKNIQRFCGNYEAILGYITNFSYSFNENGSYSCSVKIMSKGTLLEGLKIPSNTGCGVSEVTGSDKAIKTPFHLIFEKARERIEEEYGDESETLKRILIRREWRDGSVTGLNFYGKMIIHKNTGLFGIDFLSGDDKAPLVYIPLSDFLEIVNATMRCQRNLPSMKFQTKWLPNYTHSVQKYTRNPNYVPQPYVSFAEHFSLDPGKALLPVKAYMPKMDEIEDRYAEFVEALTEADSSDDAAGKLRLSMFPEEDLDLSHTRKLWSATDSGYYYNNQLSISKGDNIIQNILVSISFIEGCLDGIIDSENGGNYSMKELVRNVLDGIQKAMGNVNSFDMHVDPVTEEIVIVDRNCISSDKPTEKDPPIIVSGPKTTCTGLQITSEISSEVANEMAIAATTPAENASGSSSNIDLVFWNEGCKDRHPHKSEEDSQGGEDKIGKVMEEYADLFEISPLMSSPAFLAEVTNLYKNFSSNEAESEEAAQDFGSFVESSFGNLFVEGETLFKRCVNRDLQKIYGEEGAQNMSSYFQAGVVPVKISFTMRGIGRFLIGTTFRISEGLLPRKYKDWRNIITGVEHNIDRKGWYTTVTALYYPVLAIIQRPGESGGPGYIDPDEATPNTTYALKQEAAEQQAGLQNMSGGGFFKEYWSKRHQTKGACAKYCHDMARCWVGGKKVLNAAMQGSGYNAGDVDANTHESLAVRSLKKLGWQVKFCDPQIQASQIENKLRMDLPDGSIAVYFMNYKPSKQIRSGVYLYGDYGGKAHYHVQMKASGIKPVGWTTSTMDNYKCNFVYKGRESRNKFSWYLCILTPPVLHSDWKA